MKYTKFLSVLFAVIAALLIVSTAVGYAVFHSAPPMIGTSTNAAEAVSEELIDSICNMDYTAAGEILYGKPALQWAAETASPLSTQLWTAYTNSMTCEFSGPCYATEAGIFRDVTVTALDISALSPKIQERFDLLLEPYLAESRRNTEIYDENGIMRQDFTAGVLYQAIDEILSEDNAHAVHTITLELVFEDGQWWVVPSQSLIDVVVGIMPQ